MKLVRRFGKSRTIVAGRRHVFYCRVVCPRPSLFHIAYRVCSRKSASFNDMAEDFALTGL